MALNLQQLKKQFENELTDNILNFWVKEVYGTKQLGIYSKIYH
jgi:mannose/cellobiose epimerase-like protein (N-acyl-D-glucosamine 2-epimerase family)